MSTIDQQFVEYIVKTLVNNPDKVTVERTTDERGVLLTLTVDASDTGRVIGRAGATAQSIRTLLRALGTKNQARYNLKIADGEEANVVEDEAGKTENTVDAQAETEDSAAEEEIVDDLAEKTRAEIADLDDLEI